MYEDLAIFLCMARREKAPQGAFSVLRYNNSMDPQATPPAPESQTLKEKVQTTSREFVSDHYEGFARSSMNIILSILKFIKNSIIQMLGQILNRD